MDCSHKLQSSCSNDPLEGYGPFADLTVRVVSLLESCGGIFSDQ